MWHFKKDREEFRTFAASMVNSAPELLNLKKVGHDLDMATAQGMEDIFIDAKHLWCTQHLQGRDKEQLKKMKANDRTINKIMADIYGQHDGYLIEHAWQTLTMMKIFLLSFTVCKRLRSL